MRQRKIIQLVAAAALAISTGCEGGRIVRAQAPLPAGGSPARGHQVILDKNCGSCHTIPGVRGAQGLVGPPLFFYSRRTYIAGQLPNSPDNLVRWVRSPQSVEANTAMPALGLTEQQARDVAAYLYTLK